MDLATNRPAPPVSPIESETSGTRSRPHPGVSVYLNPEPYPEVTGSNDPETVALLKQDYAGRVSELSAVTQYIFQNMQATYDETFANAILQIAIVEMTHLDMLGDAIKTLGGSPRFDDEKYYWNASYVDFSMPIRDMLRVDIESETAAIAAYEKQAAQTRNPSVRALLLRIVEDEKLHLRFFREMLAGQGTF